MQTCTRAKKQRAELKSRSQVAGLGWSYLYEPDHPRPPRYVSTAESTAAINQNALCSGEIFRTAAETKKPQKKKKRRRRGKQREGVILLQTAGLRHFPVKILNGTGRQTQPYKTISTTIWLRGDVLVVSLKTLHSLSPPLPSPLSPIVSHVSVLLKFAGGCEVLLNHSLNTNTFKLIGVSDSDSGHLACTDSSIINIYHIACFYIFFFCISDK